MSITNQINRIQTNIGNAYSVSLQKGATMPQTQNSANLSDTIASIPQHDEVLEFSLSPELTLIPDKYVSYRNGAEYAAEHQNVFSVTDYFEVSPGMKIKLVSFTRHVANASGICFYDSDKVFISGNQYAAEVQDEAVFQVPYGAVYCRFTISTAKEASLKCYFGGFAEAINIAAEPPQRFHAFEDITDYRINHYIKWDDGLLAYNSYTFFCSTDYIPVSGMKKVVLKNVKTRNAETSGIAFYNHRMGFISGAQYPNTDSTDYTAALPADTAYIRFTFRRDYASHGIMLTDEQYRAAIAFKNSTKTPLTGKLLYVNGDSITYGYNVDTSANYDTALATALGKKLNYATLTAYRNRCDLINCAVSNEPLARIIVHGQEKNGFLSDPARTGSIPQNADYITMMFGWNDFWWGGISEKEKWLSDTYGEDIWYPENTSQIGTEGFTTQAQYDAVENYEGQIDGVTYRGNAYFKRKFLGHITDTTPWTWYGAWNYVLKWLKDRYPKTIVGVIMCYGTNADYRGALREVCEKHGIPLLDIYSDKLPLFYGKESSCSSITADQIAANKNEVLLSDNIHPSYNGHQRLSDMYSGWLNTL